MSTAIVLSSSTLPSSTVTTKPRMGEFPTPHLERTARYAPLIYTAELRHKPVVLLAMYLYCKSSRSLTLNRLLPHRLRVYPTMSRSYSPLSYCSSSAKISKNTFGIRDPRRLHPPPLQARGSVAAKAQQLVDAHQRRGKLSNRTMKS